MNFRYIQGLFFVLISISCKGQYANQMDNLSVSIDSMMNIAIDSSYFPGGQLLIAHQDSIVHHKAYGYHTYDNKIPVKTDHLYDLASITKVISGLPILMQLQSIGKFEVSEKLSTYCDESKGSNKGNLSIKNILCHQAKLEPYFVFWKEAQKEDGTYKRRTFKSKKKRRYPIYITDSLYLHKKYKNKMFDRILESPLLEKEEYKYSGIFFLLLPEIIKDITQISITEYLNKYFLEPLKIKRLTYNPLEKFPITEIVPTENDTFFRQQLVHGTVHDEAAAMLSGISCNAGLFGNSQSLYSLFRMYMQNGKVDGHKYISPEVINQFTSYQFEENRRGLGFDKPPRKWDDNSYVAQSASPDSYGHSGFTGTFVWADPAQDLIVILLTNRVHPSRENRGIYTSNFRPRLHQMVYDYLAH